MTTESIAIIGCITTVVSGLGGVALGYFFANKTATNLLKRQEFAKASASFRCAFTKEIRLLSIIHPNHSPGEFLKTYDILTTAYVKHQNAVICFEPYLRNPCLTFFKTKWKEYCCYNEKSKQAEFSKYKTGAPRTDELQVRNLAVLRIEVLLKFADPLK